MRLAASNSLKGQSQENRSFLKTHIMPHSETSEQLVRTEIMPAKHPLNGQAKENRSARMAASNSLKRQSQENSSFSETYNVT